MSIAAFADMSSSRQTDPAERSPLMRLFYRDWRPTALGRRVNQLQGVWSALGLPPSFMAVLEVRGRKSGRRRSTPIVLASVDGDRYLVSMLGPGSDWVKKYVRIAPSGRQHFPVSVDATLSEFDTIAKDYPVYRIDPL